MVAETEPRKTYIRVTARVPGGSAGGVAGAPGVRGAQLRGRGATASLAPLPVAKPAATAQGHGNSRGQQASLALPC